MKIMHNDVRVGGCKHDVSFEAFLRIRLCDSIFGTKGSLSVHSVITCSAGSFFHNWTLGCSYQEECQTLLQKSCWNFSSDKKFKPINLVSPLLPKISLVILLTICYTVLVMLVYRVWY